jgi:hypothetical protein
MACSQGALAKMAMKEGSGNLDFSSGATQFPFFRESLQKKNSVVHPDVIIGSRGEVSERARFGPNFTGGWVVMALTPGDAATVFPWILGADASGTTFDLAETLQTFGVLVDKVTGVHEFYDGVINRAVIHGKQNGPGGPPNWITVALQMVFKGYNAPGASDAFPSLSLGVTGGFAPLVFEDSVLTLGGTAQETKEFTIDINNYVQPRYVNNLNPTALCPAHRTVTISTLHAYDSTTDDMLSPAITGLAGTKTIAITNGTVSITFTFGTLQAPTLTPIVSGKKEIDLQMQFAARSVSSTPALSCTIDSTV